MLVREQALLIEPYTDTALLDEATNCVPGLYYACCFYGRPYVPLQCAVGLCLH